MYVDIQTHIIMYLISKNGITQLSRKYLLNIHPVPSMRQAVDQRMWFLLS